MREQWIPGSFSPHLPRAWVGGYTLAGTRVLLEIYFMGRYETPSLLKREAKAVTAMGRWCSVFLLKFTISK